MKRHQVRTIVSLAIALMLPHGAAAQKVNHATIGEIIETGEIYECPAGAAVAGLSQWHRDRLMGISVTCVKRKPVLGAFWDAIDALTVEPRALRIGLQPANAAVSHSTCPYNFFLIGLSGETADYQERPKDGLAHVDAPRRRVTDLAPVCRGPEGAIFRFSPNRLTALTPLRDQASISWTGETGCPKDFGAVGVRYSRARSNEVGGFTGVELICDRLSRMPVTGKQ